jgi:hypothetical protein
MKRKLATYFPLAVLALGLTLGMAAALMALRPGVSSVDAAPASAISNLQVLYGVGLTTTTTNATATNHTVTWTTDQDYAVGLVATVTFPLGTVITVATTGTNVLAGFGTGVDLAAARTAAIAALATTNVQTVVLTTGGDGRRIATVTTQVMNPPLPNADTVAATADDIVAVAVRWLAATPITTPNSITGIFAVDTNMAGDDPVSAIQNFTVVTLNPVTSDTVLPFAATTSSNSPRTAGELAEFAFTFVVNGNLASGTGEIRITMDKDIPIPASIAASAVLIQANKLTAVSELPSATCLADATTADGTDADADSSGANQVIPLIQAPAFDVDVVDPNRRVIIIKVPDMNTATGAGTCGGGSQGIAAGATITVTLTTAAGIKNEGETSGKLGRSDLLLKACTAACTTASPNLVVSGDDSFVLPAIRPFIEAKITLNGVDGARGTRLTAVAKGLKDGTTATFWLDADNDNFKDAAETTLADVVVGSDDTATATFTVNNPPFKPGKVNRIGVQDGRLNQVPDGTLPNFELRGSVEATPTTVKLGDTVTVQMKDFDGGSSCDVKAAVICTGGTLGSYSAAPSFLLGGIALDKTKFSGTTVLNTVGEATFTATVPNGVPIGTQALEIRNACCLFGGGEGSTRRQNLTIGGAVLILTPTTVVPNQTLNIVGNDYTTSDLLPTPSTGGVAVNETVACTGVGAVTSSMTIQGVPIPNSKINEGNAISVAAGGNWSTSIIIPVTTTTTTPGTYDLKVTDCRGREGVAKLTIPARVVTLTPLEGQVGTPVTIRGTGFPSKNDRTGNVSINVTIEYDAGSSGGKTSTSAQPDASGNISATLNVPTNANIPSDNNVTTKFNTEAPTVSEVINTVVHSVPKASLAILPATGKPGTKVTATIKGAKAFSTITSALIGASLDVKPAPTPFTDGVGNLSFDFIVPQMEVGVQNLEIKIGTTTASAAFSVEPATGPIGTTPASSTPQPVAAALATPLGADYVRSFHFNNQTKVWAFHDPRPDFEAISTLKEIVGGQVYWINVSNDKTITFCGRSVQLFKAEGGWNLIPC